ncbi:MAG TPA: terminase small subunit [Noviherbaspirillum sp.]|jgi:phage terminase small subunit|uniref:terminase small subunit n=1 Tax=Noviherbaspirillum sp. TaxID=1926288 RepID=UPI002DDD37FA|nr:terminase small subunit [Noviherbaspirillum sp.]HEV2612527.1 terminase small subunit [Noviherbaspirillum sp.]
MAGVKGRSGGRREGAGRKPQEPAVTAYTDPLDFLRAVWKGELEANATQVRAASAALPFIHKKLGEGTGKKEEAEEKQKSAAKGRFGTRQQPKLAANGGKLVE